MGIRELGLDRFGGVRPRSAAAEPGPLVPEVPSSWFAFGSERELARGPLSRVFFGKRLVAFRTASARYAVLDARCAHMRADLGAGRVDGEHLLCPYHEWAYGADGRCAHVPGAARVPEFARQTSYPCALRHGWLYFFHGSEALFPLPFFEGLEPAALCAGRAQHFEAECPWHLIAGNAFDLRHLRPVHARRLLDEPVIDAPSPFARRIRYTSRVLGLTAADRWVRALAGATVSISITVWAGNLSLVVARFPRLTSYISVLATPLQPACCRVSTLVYRERSPSALGRWTLQPLSLAARRALTRRFLREDVARLAGIECDPRTLLDEDLELARYVAWLARLPRADACPADEPAQAPAGARGDPCSS
jgi:nitrite reductase/ring-hydroxylating ferredoxin subunit